MGWPGLVCRLCATSPVKHGRRRSNDPKRCKVLIPCLCCGKTLAQCLWQKEECYIRGYHLPYWSWAGWKAESEARIARGGGFTAERVVKFKRDMDREVFGDA